MSGFLIHKKTIRYTKQDAIALSALLIAYAIFNLLLINKFAVITDGWFQDYARYIINGQVMYRDFYMFIPPVFPWLMTLISYISDYSILALRVYGLIERLVLIAVVYCIFRRLFSPKVLFVSLLTAAVVYISNIQDLFYGYYQTSFLFSVLMLFSFIKLYEHFDDNKCWCFALLAGLITGLTISTKHTTGIILFFSFCLTLFLLLRPIDWKKTIKVLCCVLLGTCLFVGTICCVLAVQDSLVPCINALFQGGSAKGGLLKTLFSFIPRIITAKSMLLVFFTLLLLILLYHPEKSQPKKCLFLYRFWEFTEKKKKTLFLLCLLFITVIFVYILYLTVFKNGYIETYNLKSILFFLFVFLGFFCLWLLPERWLKNRKSIITLFGSSIIFIAIFIFISRHQINYIDYSMIRSWRQDVIFAAFFLLFFYIIYLFYQILGKKRRDQSICLLIAGTAWVIMYVHGMSHIIEDHGTLLAFTLLNGMMLTAATPYLRLKNAVVFCLCLFAILPITVQRNYCQYQWWGAGVVPSRYESVCNDFDDPHLCGLYSSTEVVSEFNEIYHLIDDLKKNGDTLYSFPHITYFNVMSGLSSPTYGKVDYFDVCPDNVAEEDSKILFETEPDFILWQNFSKETWKIHEDFFRSGKPSGQRSLEVVYKKLTNSGKYIFLGDYSIAGGESISIWHKK